MLSLLFLLIDFKLIRLTIKIIYGGFFRQINGTISDMVSCEIIYLHLCCGSFQKHSFIFPLRTHISNFRSKKSWFKRSCKSNGQLHFLVLYHYILYHRHDTKGCISQSLWEFIYVVCKRTSLLVLVFHISNNYFCIWC